MYKGQHLPEHVGIIMDGNGRWAKKRGLPRSAGHVAGASNFRTIAKYCSQIGIRYLTVYAFSTENWKRPQEEVKALMRLFLDNIWRKRFGIYGGEHPYPFYWRCFCLCSGFARFD